MAGASYNICREPPALLVAFLMLNEPLPDTVTAKDLQRELAKLMVRRAQRTSDVEAWSTLDGWVRRVRAELRSMTQPPSHIELAEENEKSGGF